MKKSGTQFIIMTGHLIFFSGMLYEMEGTREMGPFLNVNNH